MSLMKKLMSGVNKDQYYLDSLEIIENFLNLMAKKEKEISELYDRLEELENRCNKFKQPEEPEHLNAIVRRNMFTTVVADPIPATRVRLREILSHNAGCTVISEASTGKDLLASYEKHRPNFVVSEIELPTIEEGYRALKEIKAAYPKACIIVISSHVDDAILLRVMEIGAFDFMLKPINHLRLLKNVERIRKQA